MPETITVAPSNLIIDTENPRIPRPNSAQNEAQRMLAENQKGKLLVLARDIVNWGLNPGDLPFVIPLKGDKNRYVVIEGNRRLTALRALENPDSFRGALDDKTIKALRVLSNKYLEDPIDWIDCIAFKDKTEARHWIELKHLGPCGGAGTVEWAPDEKGRYNERGDDIAVQSLNFLEEHGHLAAERRAQVPVTTLRRLLNTPEIRSRIGIDREGSQLQVLGPPQKVAKALLHVIGDITKSNNKRKKVGEFLTKKQREDYANSLPSSVIVKPSKNGPALAKPKAASAPKKAIPKKPSHKRDRLIPRDCVLAITGPRVRDIEIELRDLSLQNHPNAISVLFRVFMELSIDSQIKILKLSVTPHHKLRDKIQAIVKELIARKRLTVQESRPVLRACQKGSFLAPSIDLLHDYIHNENVFPSPGELRAHWSSLQAFFIAMWR